MNSYVSKKTKTYCLLLGFNLFGVKVRELQGLPQHVTLVFSVNMNASDFFLGVMAIQGNSPPLKAKFLPKSKHLYNYYLLQLSGGIKLAVVLKWSLLLVALEFPLIPGVPFLQAWIIIGAYSNVLDYNSSSRMWGPCFPFFRLIIYLPCHSFKVFPRCLVHPYCFLSMIIAPLLVSIYYVSLSLLKFGCWKEKL